MKRPSGTKTAPGYPYRVALAGGWGDHNFVNFLADGYVVVVQIQPTVTFHDRCGICSSTRQILMQKYPRGIPDHIDKYQLATELYYWENDAKSRLADPRTLGDPSIRESICCTTTSVITTAYYPKP